MANETVGHLLKAPGVCAEPSERCSTGSHVPEVEGSQVVHAQLVPRGQRSVSVLSRLRTENWSMQLPRSQPGLFLRDRFEIKRRLETSW